MKLVKGRLANLCLAVLIGVAQPVLASGEHEGGHGHEDQGHGHGSVDFAFGEAASAEAVDRTIEVVARDIMRYEPARISVEAGETVTFRVHNEGKLQHAFTLGSPAYQERHAQEMQGMPANELAHHMDDSPNGVVVQPGETETLTWRFEQSGPIQFACHIPGHYLAGMKGRLEIK